MTCAVAGLAFGSVSVHAEIDIQNNSTDNYTLSTNESYQFTRGTTTLKSLTFNSNATLFDEDSSNNTIAKLEITNNLTSNGGSLGGLFGINGEGIVNVGGTASFTTGTDSRKSSIKITAGALNVTGDLTIKDGTTVTLGTQGNSNGVITSKSTILIDASSVTSAGGQLTGKNVTLSGTLNGSSTKYTVAGNENNTITATKANDEGGTLTIEKGATLEFTKSSKLSIIAPSGTNITNSTIAIKPDNGSAHLNVSGGATFNGSTISVETATSNENTLAFESVSFTNSQINIGTDTVTAKARLSTTSDTLVLSGATVNAVNASEFTAQSQNGAIAFGQMKVAGSVYANNESKADGAATLTGAVTLEGATANTGLIKAASITAGNNASLAVTSSKYGKLQATGTGSVMDLSNLAATEIAGNLTLALSGTNQSAKLGDYTVKGTLQLTSAQTSDVFDMSSSKLAIDGGKTIVSVATTGLSASNELTTPTLTVKDLNISATSAQGALTIQNDAQVKVTGTLNVNSNATQGLITLDGTSARLIVDAKNILKADDSGVVGNYVATIGEDVIGGKGTLKITNFVDFAKSTQTISDDSKPKLNLTQFINLKKSLLSGGEKTGTPYQVLIELDPDAVGGVFDKGGNIDRGDDNSKAFLDAGLSATGSLVYGVTSDAPSTSPTTRQQWGAAQLADGSDGTLLVGVSSGKGSCSDLTLDKAGAGTGDKTTGKKYFVRYDGTGTDNKDLLGNLKFIETSSKATLVGGGVIGSVSAGDGIQTNTLTFQDSKAEDGSDLGYSQHGFASGTINLADDSTVTVNHADVVVGLSGSDKPINSDRDAGNLTTGKLVVKNDGTIKVKGESNIGTLALGNDTADKAGSTNKVEFVGKAEIDALEADGSKVTSGATDQTGTAKVNFKAEDGNTVGTLHVATGNNLSLTGKAKVTGAATVEGTLTTASTISLEGGLTVASNSGTPAVAYIASGSLASTAQVGGATGNGFLYMGSTQDSLEEPNTIEKTWAAAVDALDTNASGVTGIGYLDSTYDISSAQVNIGKVASGAAGTLTIASDGALIVTEKALAAPVTNADGTYSYSAGLTGKLVNNGTVLISDLAKIGNGTTIQLASNGVSGSDDAQWLMHQAMYYLTLKGDQLVVTYNPISSDAVLSKTDDDLAKKLKAQAVGDGFDATLPNGLGFISQVLADSVTNTDGSINTEATADRVGRTLSSATRFATLAGAAQNTQVASDMVTAQIEERSGFRTATASRMTANNGEAGALWASPLYNKARSNGFAAGAYAYGMDTDLYGMSFGADAAVAEGLRVGAAFSGGTGDSDTKGSLMKTTNDFDFYSGSLYAITDVGSVTVLTDLDYTWLKGDVKQTNNLTTLKSTVKSSVASVGVSAKRAFETEGGVTVAPYAGVRVNRLHVKGYDVKDSANNTIIKAGSQHQYYATVPVGVQVSKAFELTNGFVKPALDLGLVTTVGSRNLESRVTYTGFGETKATSEVRDRTAFTVKFGVNGEVGHFGFGVGYGFAGSQSTTNHQVYGNVRYRF